MSLPAAPAHPRSLAACEWLFDRLNPDFGVPADHTDPTGQHAMHQRETGLLLGTRVVVALICQNDPNPVVWIAALDHRIAAAIKASRKPLSVTAIAVGAHQQEGG